MRRPIVALTVAAAAALACAAAPAQHGESSAGERLYRSKCSACHRAYPPPSRDRASWAAAIAKMAPRAKLSEAERARILEYLQANAKDASPGARP